MSILDRALHRLGYAKARTGGDRLVTRDDRWSVPDYSTVENQVTLMQKLSWVFIAVTQVAEAAAGSALSVKLRIGEGIEDVENHPFELKLQRPNPSNHGLNC